MSSAGLSVSAVSHPEAPKHPLFGVAPQESRATSNRIGSHTLVSRTTRNSSPSRPLSCARRSSCRQPAAGLPPTVGDSRRVRRVSSGGATAWKRPLRCGRSLPPANGHGRLRCLQRCKRWFSERLAAPRGQRWSVEPKPNRARRSLPGAGADRRRGLKNPPRQDIPAGLGPDHVA